MIFTDAQVRAALNYIQSLPDDFPDFVYEGQWPQSVHDRVDANNMTHMRAALQAALDETPNHAKYVIIDGGNGICADVDARNDGPVIEEEP